MDKIISFIKENLEITAKEAKSTFTFLLVAIIGIAIYFGINSWSSGRESEISFKTYPIENPQSLFIENKSVDKIRPFKFNPNTASLETLTKVGIPHFVAKTIVKYREKGGKFKFKTDLAKIYSLKPETYALLENYIDLPEKGNEIQKTDFQTHKPEFVKTEKSSSKFDINLADTTQLKSLKGIGSVYASRIVKFRDALGGFHSLNQIDETFGLKPEAATIVKENTFIKSPVKTIPINSIDNFKHPYLKAFQIKNILAFRQQNGPFSTIEDLKAIKTLDEETIKKISPYLSF